MNLNLNDDQLMLRDTVARLFNSEATAERVRAAENSQGLDPALWQQVVDMGLPLMRATEAAGGLDLPLLDAALVAEELGRTLAPVPLLEAMAANRLLSLVDALGDRVAEGALFTLLPVEIRGEEPLVVPWAAVADGVIALEGQQVLLIEGLRGDAPRNLASAGHRLCSLAGDGAGRRTLLAEGPEARAHFLATVAEWQLLSAAALAGLARRALDMAATYACEREQFGRLIGGYQGIAHPLADSLAEVEGLQLLVWRAIWAIADNREDAAAGIPMARWWADEAAGRAAARALHTFGGYGVSLEYDIQLYYRRAKAWSLLGGDPQQALAEVGERLWGGDRPPLPAVGAVGIDFGLGAEAEKMAAEVRAFFEANLSDELRAKAHHSVAGYDEAFTKKLCAAGLRYPHWPVEYGGRGATPFEMAALNAVFEEYGWERITGPVTNQVAFSVMGFAQPEVKDEILGQFARGEALACLGFSEPSSGSDIYAAKTRAVRDGDDWIINGQKIFTTSGNLAHYIFLLTRTNPDVPKHRGLTIFMVPMDLPGIEIQPVHTIQDERTNITYLENVRVPDRYRLGEVDGAMAVMMYTMEMEHGGADQYRLNYQSMLDNAVAWARGNRRGGQPVIAAGDARLRLARVAVKHEVARVLCYRSLWASHHRVPGRSHFGPVSKLFTTEAYLQDSRELMNLAAPWSLFEDRHGAGHIELGYRQSIGTTIYGGTSEIMRSLIAEHGLGLPKSRS
ncbi:MAG: acyl-CoA dehydrogenase [Porticoccaceae bacterium]|nr:acyl-CoA dehydrogenase [Porticoccaceae bacterium]HLS97270.1 acyl-CoA dehydrogenase [Porticoccaceae bacterium]